VNIRKYKNNEIDDLWRLFFNTIHKINIENYTKYQIEAWAPSDLDKLIWKNKIIEINPYVAIKDSKIIGYADIQSNGLIDHFFCHYKYQRIGVGSKLFKYIENKAKENAIIELHSEVSVTAQPFFSSMGFKIIEEQTLLIRGQKLKNYKMRKKLTN